ncbi:metabolite-proton symporter [Pseudonocardia hierapolitana]|uniref:Putative proline/betaine transporter n=1 Tax=Pseudonocardia hierapolitana TaxID=1128676 RepID=A0A561SZV7_9PSEU|nr:MFS transporter [Pseudonocardia hierapolitana]TWF80365.1 metabolite-proton symporter [Pseudonocardia hierapolitana]
MATMRSEPHAHKKPSAAKVAVASFIGTTIEWYDYLVFGAATVLVFNPLFFPALDPLAGTLAGFATIAVAFLARPLGGLVFGHFGDRIGRKKMLVLSVVMMGAGTFAVGLLPTYETIGTWAPVLLVVLRFVQGFAVGGEWGGAVVMSLEHAPAHRRAFYASFPQAGVPAGTFLSSGAFFLVTLMPEEQLLSWGWRIPFLCSALLIVVGLYIRLRVTESPEFLALRERGDVVKVPAAEVFASYKRALVVGMLCMLAPNTIFYLASTFFLNYGPVHLGLSRGLVLVALLVAAAIQVVTLPLFAIVADRTGTRNFLMAGCAAVAVGAFPVFLLFDTGTVAGVFAAYLLALPVLHALVYGAISAFTAELFPPRARYTGSSVAYHLGGAVTAAPVPIVATLLLTEFGSSSAIAVYVILAAVVCGLVIAAAPRARAQVEFQPARSEDDVDRAATATST